MTKYKDIFKNKKRLFSQILICICEHELRFVITDKKGPSCDDLKFDNLCEFIINMSQRPKAEKEEYSYKKEEGKAKRKYILQNDTHDDVLDIDIKQEEVDEMEGGGDKIKKKKHKHIKKKKEDSKTKSKDSTVKKRKKTKDDYKNCLEILELEMRAKAIRAMLKMENVNSKSAEEPKPIQQNNSDECKQSTPVATIPKLEGKIIFHTKVGSSQPRTDFEKDRISHTNHRTEESKDMKLKKVVATSKMLTSIRNKMKNQKRQTKQTESISTNVEGSVQEYDCLKRSE